MLALSPWFWIPAGALLLFGLLILVRLAFGLVRATKDLARRIEGANDTLREALEASSSARHRAGGVS